MCVLAETPIPALPLFRRAVAGENCGQTPGRQQPATVPEVPAAVRAAVEAMHAEDLIEQRRATSQWDQLNQIERRLAECEQVPCPLRHLFTPVPGFTDLFLYTREITMPATALLTSFIHLHEHPFVISQGCVSVWSNEGGWETFRAPYRGVTLPATRRLLYIHEETVWTTFHVTRQTDPDAVVAEIARSPFDFGHMEGLAPEKRTAIEANHKAKPLLP